jgi:hypothetical protein
MKQSFDLKTHIRNKKGQVSSVNPYKLVIENGVKKFERPPNSGNWFNEDGSVDKVAKAVPKPVVKEFKPEAFQAMIEELQAKNEALQAKLEAAEAEEEIEIEAPAAEELDNSEELALIAEAAKKEENKGFKMPNFLGAKNG